MAFFTPFNFVTLCQFYVVTSPVTSLRNYRIREMKVFCIYSCFSVSRYINGKKKITSLDTIEFLDTHVRINNPHLKSSGIIVFLCKFYLVNSEADEKPRRNKDRAVEKST